MQDQVQTATVTMAGRDAVIPFQVAPLDVRGRAVQLGPLLDSMLGRHSYPEPVNRLLAEAVVLTVMLGTSLKFEGKFILQTQSDGAVPLIVTEFRSPSAIRAYASFDREAVDTAIKEGKADAANLMGKGTLAMTVDQGSYMQRYQGIVALDNTSFEEVARTYFRQSEQIPTEVRLAVGQTLTRGEDGKAIEGWSAGGVLLQFLPDSDDRMRQKDLHGGDGAEDHDFTPDDAWAEGLALMGTIEDIELTDSAVEPERLLYRLFHEHGVHAFEAVPVRDECGCSEDGVRGVLEGFSAEQLAESCEDDGKIRVTCEFCSTSYHFSPSEFTTTQ